MLNTFSFVGYLDGYKDVGFEYHVKKPEGLYGTTSLDRTSSENNVDVFRFVKNPQYDINDLIKLSK